MKPLPHQGQMLSGNTASGVMDENTDPDIATHYLDTYSPAGTSAFQLFEPIFRRNSQIL